MTTAMVLSLVVLAVMIVLIMSDALPFGVPPLVACILIVVLGLGDVPYAFSGFSNPTVWMLAFFMVVLAAVQKTRLVARVKTSMTALVRRGGFRSYVLLLLLVTLGASVVGMGSTGYYVLILSLVVTMPHSDEMPGSKLLMPLGFASNHPLVPVNVALPYGVCAAVLGTAGLTDRLSVPGFSLVMLFVTAGFLLWATVGYRVLPSHPVAAPTVEERAGLRNAEIVEEIEGAVMTPWRERVTLGAFAASVAAMMLVDVLGDVAYVLPGLAAVLVLSVGVLDFGEVRDNMFSPVILMTAGVIPVANALADSGLTALVGSWASASLGGSVPQFWLLMVFAALCSACACLTGSTIGTIYIFAPLAVAVSAAVGANPIAAAVAVTLAGWCGHFLPIDGLPAMVYGMGRYTMREFWAFTVPQYVVRIVFLCVGCCVAFPA